MDLSAKIETHIPTSIEELDRILGGGFEKGSVNIIEVGKGVGRDYRWISAPPALNLLLRRKPVFFIPSEGHSPETVRKWFEPIIGEELYKKCVHVFQFSSTKNNPDKNVHTIS